MNTSINTNQRFLVVLILALVLILILFILGIIVAFVIMGSGMMGMMNTGSMMNTMSETCINMMRSALP